MHLLLRIVMGHTLQQDHRESKKTDSYCRATVVIGRDVYVATRGIRGSWLPAEQIASRKAGLYRAAAGGLFVNI